MILSEKIVFASQKMSFDVTGISVDPVRTTMGACACDMIDEEDCYGTNEKCEFPEDRGWDTPDESLLAAYEGDAYDLEYMPITNRPRYPGYRYNANRTVPIASGDTWQTVSDYWDDEQVAMECRNTTNFWDLFSPSSSISYNYNPLWDYLPHLILGPGKSWDEEKGTHGADGLSREGCREISSTYVPGQHRSMGWRHLGQQEPTDDDPSDGSVTLDQKWLMGHKTKMRVAVKPYTEVQTSTVCSTYADCAAGQSCRSGYCYDNSENLNSQYEDVWLRQWHSSSPTNNWVYGHEPDRPFTEEELGSNEGVLVLSGVCIVDIPDVILVGEYIYQGCDILGLTAAGNAVNTLHGLSFDESNLYATQSEIMPMNGEVSEKRFVAGVVRSDYSLPVSDFGFLRVADVDDNDESFVREFIIGGRTESGNYNPRVWMRDSRIDDPRFALTATAMDMNIDNPQLMVDKNSKRIFLLGDDDGRVWELVERKIGSYVWQGTWDTYQNGLYLDPTGKAAVDWASGNNYFAFRGKETMGIQRIGISDKGPEVKDILPGLKGPSMRQDYGFMFHEGRNQLIVYGGTDYKSGKTMNDVWFVDPSVLAWKQVTQDAGDLPARLGGSLISGEDHKILMVGGEDQYGVTAPGVVWELALDTAAPSWKVVSGKKPTRLNDINNVIEEEYIPGQPAVYLLTVPDGVGDAEVTLEFYNASAKLVLGVIEATGETKPVFIPEKEETGAKASIKVSDGQRWAFIVGPRSEELGENADRTFAIAMKAATKSSSSVTIATLTSSRYDVYSDTAVVADWSSLKVLESDGSSLTEVASVPMTSAVDVLLEGTVAYVADFDTGIKVLDLSDATNPAVLGEDWTVGSPDSITKAGNYLLLGVGALGVEMIDVSDPASPTSVGLVDVGGTVVDVSAAGGKIFVSTLSSGVHMYHVTESGEMTPAGVYQNLGWVEDTEVRGKELHVKTSTGMVEVVDISEPENMSRENLILPLQSDFGERFGSDFAISMDTAGALQVSDLVEE